MRWSRGASSGCGPASRAPSFMRQASCKSATRQLGPAPYGHVADKRRARRCCLPTRWHQIFPAGQMVLIEGHRLGRRGPRPVRCYQVGSQRDGALVGDGTRAQIRSGTTTTKSYREVVMKITEIREKTFPIARPFAMHTSISKMTTSLVAVVTDVVRNGKRSRRIGFNSNGRYGQGGLMRERSSRAFSTADPNRSSMRRARISIRIKVWTVHVSRTKSRVDMGNARSRSARSTWQYGMPSPRSGQALFRLLGRTLRR